MSVNGIWRVEILGPGGWEPLATAFLEDGTYKAASEDHYTVGSYEVSGDRIEITGIATYYGKVRTVFGRNEKETKLKFEGRIEGDDIKGQALADNSAVQTSFRISRLADLP